MLIMNKRLLHIFFFIFILAAVSKAQIEEEPVLYFQMEPLDDSLFIHLQSEVYIDPPDPKAEIIVDLRDPSNQTLMIQGTVFPFLAFSPESRAKVQTYPFKLNLEETVGFHSVFTRVLSKIKFNKITSPPTKAQITPLLGYINPYVQLFGGERLGLPLKGDIGFSFGVGTEYSGPFETNFAEFNFHILGVKVGVINGIDALTEFKTDNNHNNLYTTLGIQFGYVIPFGNFFEFSSQIIVDDASASQLEKFRKFDTPDFKAQILTGSYFSWEVRYPVKLLGATRGKIYFARFLNEYHIGFSGREMALAGNVFDFRFDGMIDSEIRQPQYVFDIMVQRLFDYWAFSAVGIGPGFI